MNIIEDEQLMKEWDYERNINLSPAELSCGSHKIANWICEYGHRWSTSIKNRSKGNGTNCPYCAGKKVLIGFNDIATTHKELLDEWNYEKNGEDIPENYSKGSHRRVWWKCKRCSFEWKAMISSRAQGHGCPSCAKRKKGDLTKRNDIFNSYPELLEEWDYDANIEEPQYVLASSEKKVYWKCSTCGYKWHQTPYNRAIRKSGCPVCANKVIISGVNDLATLRPSLLNEWNYERNIDITPEEVSVGTNTKVWWRCTKGHEWIASISNRAKQKNTGCPICDSERKTSLPEKTLVFYLGQFFDGIQESYRPSFLKRSEIDIFIPELSLGIEYDGEIFHQDNERDIKKNDVCRQAGITLLRIREPKCPSLPDNIHVYVRRGIYEDTLDEMVEFVFEYINENYKLDLKPDVNMQRDRMQILTLCTTIEKENSLVTQFSDIAREWDYEKNENLSPKMFSYGSNRKVWWKCSSCQNSWQAKINSRVSLGTGCPVCGRKKAEKNKASNTDDRFLKNHALFKEYDVTKNEEIDINTLRIGSKKEVWWKCSKCSMSWKAQVYTRTQGYGKCPSCND